MKRSITKTFTVNPSSGKYRTIASVYRDLSKTSSARVVITPGTYDEQLILFSNTTFEIQAGATIDYTVSSQDPTVATPISVANCTITGAGAIKRSNAFVPVVWINNSSQVTIEGVSIDVNTDDGTHFAKMAVLVGVSASQTDYPHVTINTNISAFKTAVMIKSGTVVGTGNLYALYDYCLWVSAAAGADSANVTWTGDVTADGNSAVAIYGGTINYTGHALSSAWFGFEQGGGTANLKDATLESTFNGGYQLGDAINKYGGESLSIDNCTMTCFHANAYSISEEGHATTVALLSDCHANRNKSPLITLIGPGNLIVA